MEHTHILYCIQGFQTPLFSTPIKTGWPRSFIPISCLHYLQIRSVLEYGCQVWNYGASQYLSDDVERVQRLALRIIYPQGRSQGGGKGGRPPPPITKKKHSLKKAKSVEKWGGGGAEYTLHATEENEDILEELHL